MFGSAGRVVREMFVPLDTAPTGPYTRSDLSAPKKQRHTAKRLRVQAWAFIGGKTSVRRGRAGAGSTTS